MSKSYIDKAWAVVPEFENRISRFDKKLRMAQYAERSIYEYKDYWKGGKHGVMTMDIDGFLNLLSQHILPDRFVRIRHYGILSPACREILRCIQQQLNVPPVPKERKKKSYLDICNEKGWEIGVCKDCNCRRIIVSIINPAPRAPPFRIWHMGN